MAARNTKEKSNKKDTGTKSTGAKGTAAKQTKQPVSKKSVVKTKPPVKEPEVQEKEKKHLSLAAAVALGVLFAFVLELSNFNVFGTFGGWVKYGQFGLFGVMAYIFPLLVLLVFVASTYEEKKTRVILCCVVMFLMMTVLSHLVSPMSLNNHNVLSYFKTCAENLTGGGIIGGAIALGLYLLLSKTGAIIITILVILICLFFVFEDQIRSLFHYLFSESPEDEDEEDYEEYETAYREYRASARQQRSRRNGELYRGDELRRREEQQSYEEPEFVRRGSVRARTYYEDPVIITEDREGTVIRLVRSRKKHGRTQTAPLTRTNKKAQPLRDGSTDIVRSTNKAKGISSELDMLPHNANGDEIHEITRRSASAKRRSSGQPSRDIFSDTLIVPEKEDQIEWNLENAAAVTNVTQAAVNRKAREEKPVKVRRSDPAGAGQRENTQRENTQREESAGKKAGSSQTATKRQTSSEPAYFAPPMELLSRVKGKNRTSEAELEKIASNLEMILEQFGVNATVTDIQAGPSVTRFELQPELGTRVNKITALADDLKLNLGVTEIRIEAPIPGRQAVGIEIPNKNRQTVYMRELLEEPTLIGHSSKIAFAAGKDISGNVIVADIAKMPHLLVAGTTGSGKSVFLNTILMTILYRAKPSEVGLIIIDPKKVEFGIYQGIPHLMKDVVTDPGQAVSTLRWAVNEMTNRYQRMQMSSVREFKSYNAKVAKGTVNPQEENPRMMNQIVIIIDELADLMMVAKKEAEALICRLAQLARAAGIHLIIATQRPSVDVVTGLIKANVPARVALLVSSQIDSRTIIDMPGAEKLLGNGDMLFYPTGYVKPVRVQGAFVSDDEIQATVDYLIDNNRNDYFAAESQEIEKFLNSQNQDAASGESEQSQEGSSKYDEFFFEAGKLCIEMGKASSSMLQRRFNLGFNRAARIIDQLEEFGAVGPQNGAKPREILVDTMTFEEMYQALQNGDSG
ncbi:MAG: DNA translocase FtsK [Parasporobacterium sp.]|nr:DNA translocase FtsK [Parasporobacterium sp.]